MFKNCEYRLYKFTTSSLYNKRKKLYKKNIVLNFIIKKKKKKKKKKRNKINIYIFNINYLFLYILL